MRNRQKPSGLVGEVLPPEPTTRGGNDLMYRQPAIPTLREFDGVFNIMARLRAWGQTKGYKALTGTLDSYDDALRMQGRVGQAIEELEIQEERLHPQNLDVLREAERRNIDATLANSEGRLQDAMIRNRHSQLRSQISDENLQRELIRAQRRREKEENLDDAKPKTEPASEEEKSVQEQIEALAKPLLAAQTKLNNGLEDGSLSEAAKLALEQEISIYLSQMEELRTKYTTGG